MSTQLREALHEKVMAFADWLCPETVTLRHAQWQLITAARNAASKLRCEMHPKRNSVTPKAEYDILIEECAKYNEALNNYRLP